MSLRLALKIDVDTDRGTRIGVPQMIDDLKAAQVPATFLFSLGPDQTGRAISRVFRPGFFQKVSRTSVVQIYGVRTLLNGTLLPAPHVGRRNEAVLRAVRDAGFEIGIHCYNHYRWQDHVHTMGPAAVAAEFDAARTEFRRIFGTEAVTAGAAGWQSNADSRDAYEKADLLYASDSRGTRPFFPRINGSTWRTLEIPTTLPTLDELMGRPEYPDDIIAGHLIAQMRPDVLNVLTVHAEIEGMGRRALFQDFLRRLPGAGVKVVSLEAEARRLLENRAAIPVCDVIQGSIDGRSGLLAVQAA
ncbi:MAG TPA: polysaccharide deacetylase family protein [Candidatus Didemnitutus sp.]|nr:polysaccharide deacetylase family protein [Candidatus Didemnitutus sp.]